MAEQLSCLVSHILDRLGYSEEMRWFRVSKYSESNFVCSLCSDRTGIHGMIGGSKLEGASKYRESDFDVLKIYSDVIVTECEDIDEGDSDLTLYMECDTAPPGYCKLQLLQAGGDNIWHQVFLHNYCYVTCRGYVRSHLSSTFVIYMEHKATSHDHEICGPSIKGQDPGARERDNVPAIRCSHIPSCFRSWFRRQRRYDWPTKEVMEQIAKADVFVVPVGKHGSGYQFLQWRISFNMAENILIQNFGTVQYKIYILLKMVVKEVIQESITSYIVKTLMLWAAEEIPTESWREEKLVDLLVHMIERLYRCVQSGVCSMYFIPEDNILDGRINEDNQQAICTSLSTLLDDGSQCIFRIPSIARQLYQWYMHVMLHVPLHNYSHDTVREKASILLGMVRQIRVHTLSITDRDFIQERAAIPYKDLLTDLVCVKTLTGSGRQKLVVHCSSQTLSKLSLQKWVDATTQHDSNIKKYKTIRQCENICHRNCSTDVLSGRVTLGLVFYMLGKFEAALGVLNDGAYKVRNYMPKQSVRRQMSVMQERTVDDKLYKAIGNEGLSSSEVLQHFTIPDILLDHQMEPCLPKALRYEVYKSCDGKKQVRTDPEVILCYLQYLCCSQLGQRRHADIAFRNLVWYATRSDSIEYREVGLNILGQVLLKKGQYDHAAKALVKSVMLRKQYPYLERQPAFINLKANAAYCHIAILLNKIHRRN